jgi:hypothetical protein
VYQRVTHLGFELALSVGKQTNDKELSYYAQTPSGFEWKVGWNRIESTQHPTSHQGISILGHTPEGQSVIDKLDQFAIAARSLVHREDTVPALSAPAIPDD